MDSICVDSNNLVTIAPQSADINKQQLDVQDMPTNGKLLLNIIEQSSELSTKDSNLSSPRNSESDVSLTPLKKFEEEKKVFEGNYDVVEVKKSKKTEKKLFSKLIGIDRDAFGTLDGQVFIMKQFWNSKTNKFIVAQKKNSSSVSGYACYFTQPDGSCYLMRIGVRTSSQRKGIGRLLINHLLKTYNGKLELEVSSDNEQAVKFYKNIGLKLASEYTTNDGVTF